MILVDYSRKLWKGSETSLKDLPHVVETIDNPEQLEELLENLKVECADFETHPKRRKIMIFIDNYDAFSDDSRKYSSFFENASALIRNYQTAGVFMVIAGSLGIMSASDDLRKVFAAPSFGLALKSADAVSRLNGKFPRSLADVDLPMGRAFLIRSGITNMLQIATPYANDEDIEGSLDQWVKRIRNKYPQPSVQWIRKGTGGKGKKKESAGPEISDAKAKEEAELAKYDIADLRKKIIEFGMSESTVKLFSNRDIVENAKALGLLDEEQK